MAIPLRMTHVPEELSSASPTGSFLRREEIFCAAMEHETAQERRALLERECGEDRELRASVELLLAAQPDAEQVFEATEKALLPADELARAMAEDPEVRSLFNPRPEQDESVGVRIGRYKLLQIIGKGGWGVVYLAEQEEPVRRQLALKVVKLGMDTDGVIARFEAERQALAMMDHPNIARVLDAGATESGRPYFVMELVRGPKITDHCDERRLGLAERLRLFLQVCHAIQHAHQKGVIHRDIKPSNILVTAYDEQPAPKVIDFGIAKSIEGPLTARPHETIVSTIIGTPAYMSPEQAESGGLDVDTRSDIYSLGVLLYELLTGETPFAEKELVEAGAQGMRRKLRETEPLAPSAKLTNGAVEKRSKIAELRGSAVEELPGELSHELDWIAMKALEKDRNRRYQTPRELALDVQRHLDHEEVHARPPSRLYRWKKLVVRNKGAFLAGALVCLALTAGFCTSAWMYLQEKAARREAERLQINEAQLRRQAEMREKITQATVLLSHDDSAAADDLVSDIPASLCPRYMEAVRVFRTLTDWQAINLRWREASQRALVVVQVDRVDESDQSGGVSCDYISASAALLQIGEVAAYRKLCGEALDRFATTSSPVAAEQILKTCLLLPVDDAASSSFRTLAAIGAESLSEPFPKNPTTVEAWQLASLSLYEYRLGNWERAAKMARSALVLSDAPSRTAMANVILGMALQHLGQPNEAKLAVKSASTSIDARFERPLSGAPMDTWHSWIMARVLLHEANGVVVDGPVARE